MSQEIPKPPKKPIYDIEKSYLENAEHGPFFDEPFPEMAPFNEKTATDFLGFKVSSPIGVPAGPLLNARWVEFALKMGFDIVTYKTIRSQEHAAHPVPNMVYVDTKGFLRVDEEGGIVKLSKNPPKTLDELALTNSFGMPSRDPEYLLKDIDRAVKAAKKGQVVIVSVVGTPRANEDFVEDFVRAALLAKEGGAKIIEANFSCPNVLSKEGSIDSSPEAIFEISSRMKKAIKDIPLIIKVGVYTEKAKLKQVMEAASTAGVSAIEGINTMSMQILDEKGVPALGENRKNAGVCGAPIRHAALDFIEMASSINKAEKFDLVILGTGGITEYSHFDLFFEKGADVAMSAIGMMWDPYLALRYFEKGKKPWIKGSKIVS